MPQKFLTWYSVDHVVEKIVVGQALPEGTEHYCVRFIYRLSFLMLVGSIVVFTIARVILKIAQAILKTVQCSGIRPRGVIQTR